MSNAKSESQELVKTTAIVVEQPDNANVSQNPKIAEEQAAPAKRDAAGGGGRKRKRHLYNSIRAQMEFYFGDANLTKDRFLRRFVEQDPYVPLDIFLTFNKIKTLTQDVGQIAKSLSSSQLLEVDETGQKVKRKTALPEQRNVAEKTLYVEALPATASHDWLKEVFSRYGPVAYVSLPHYPGTRKIKEFAFIEFERSASVEKAVKAFTQVQGVLSVEHTDPSELASIRSFQQQQSSSKKKSSGSEEKEADQPQAAAAAAAAVEPAKQIKREAEAEPSQEDATAAKRIKLEASDAVVDVEPSNAAASEQSETEQSDNNNETDAEPAEGEEGEASGGEAGDNGKKRRRKRKKKAATSKPNIDASALELKVLPKSSWSSLRNKYLNLQRRMVSEAKSKLWRSTQEQQQPHQKRTPKQQQQHHPQQAESKAKSGNSGAEESEQLSDGGDADAPVPPKRRKRNKNSSGSNSGGGVHKMNMNFYGAGGVEADESKPATVGKADDDERQPLFKYEPGLIVECTLHEPCASIKEFKADMRQYPDIKYVDIKEGADVAQLRLTTPNAAEELVRQLSCAERKCKVLRGQAESQYWRKIEQDREAKLTKQVRVQQKRGREKVAKLLAKHTKFDDDGDECVVSEVGAEI